MLAMGNPVSASVTLPDMLAPRLMPLVMDVVTTGAAGALDVEFGAAAGTYSETGVALDSFPGGGMTAWGNLVGDGIAMIGGRAEGALKGPGLLPNIIDTTNATATITTATLAMTMGRRHLPLALGALSI